MIFEKCKFGGTLSSKNKTKFREYQVKKLCYSKPCILFIYIVLNGIFILSFVENTFNESLGNIGAILI